MALRAIIWLAVSSGKQAEDDKESIPEQRRRLLDVCKQYNWEVIDTIIVPGHSRVYYNYQEFAQGAFEESKIEDPLRMFDHWARKDFDIFACRDGSRFGREQSIFAEVAARTYDTGAKVFTLKNGLIDPKNRRFWVAMDGYSASSEVDDLVSRRSFGMKGRAERGLKVSSRTLFGFREIRDERGKVVKQEPNPEYSYIFDKVAVELLLGVAWNSLGKALYEKYSIVNPKTGQMFTPRFLFSVMSSATFWGHTAINYRNNSKGKIFHPWIYDESIAPPDDVLIWRNTHTPIYQGDLAEAVKDEIRRRTQVVSGRVNPVATHKFSGLVICEECGSHLVIVSHKDTGYQAMRCQNHWRHNCSQGKTINIKKIYTRVNEILEVIKEHGFEGIVRTDTSIQQSVNRLEFQIEETKSSLDSMIMGLRSLKPEQYAFQKLTEDINQMDKMLQGQNHELLTLKAKHKLQTRNQSEQLTKELDLQTFWGKSDTEINQLLHRIFYPYKLFVRDGEVTRLAEYSGRRSPREKYIV